MKTRLAPHLHMAGPSTTPPVTASALATAQIDTQQRIYRCRFEADAAAARVGEDRFRTDLDTLAGPVAPKAGLKGAPVLPSSSPTNAAEA